MKNKRFILLIIIFVLNISFLQEQRYYSFIFQKPINTIKQRYNAAIDNSIDLDWNYTLSGKGNEYPWEIALDSSGNIYVTGYINSSYTEDKDLFFAKFDKNGHYQWNRTFGGEGDDRAYGIAIDSFDNIYIAGIMEDSLIENYIVLVKYDNLGNYQWDVTWVQSYDDDCFAIALDSTDNIYLTGKTLSSTFLNEILLVKFNSLGQYQWNRTFGGNYLDTGYDIAIDLSDNIYVSGLIMSEFSTSDACIFKFDSSGDYQWNITFDYSDYDHGLDIAIDSLGNILISGVTYNSSDYDMFLLKYDSNGMLLFDRIWGNKGIETLYDMVIDSEENIFLVGYVNYTSNKNYDFYLTKFNNIGEQQFNYTWGGKQHDIYTGICIDSLDSIYITGVTSSFGVGENNIYLEKYIPTIPPKPFNLTTDADLPDLDGSFNLSWTDSVLADYYFIYYYNSIITEINASLTFPSDNNSKSPYEVKDLSSGTYYFVVVAYNRFGYISSNCLEIIVQITSDSKIPGFHPIVLIFISIPLILYSIKKQARKIRINK